MNLHYFHSLKLKLLNKEMMPAIVTPHLNDAFEIFPQIGEKLLMQTTAFDTLTLLF